MKSLQEGAPPICRLLNRFLRWAPKLPSPPLVAGRIESVGDVKLCRVGKKHHRVNTQDLPPDSPHQPKEPACTRARCVPPLCTPPVTVIAQCSHCTLLSLHLAITSSGLPVNFPTLRLPNKSESRKVGKLASWRAHRPPYRSHFITSPPRAALTPG